LNAARIGGGIGTGCEAAATLPVAKLMAVNATLGKNSIDLRIVNVSRLNGM
jgi:hypothetical protein